MDGRATVDTATLQDVRTLADLRQCRELRVDATPWRVQIGLADSGSDAGPWKLVYCLANYTAEGPATFSHKEQTYGQMLGPVFLDMLGADDAEHGPLRDIAEMQSPLPGQECLFAVIVPTAWEGTYRLRIRSPAGHVLAERRIPLVSHLPRCSLLFGDPPATEESIHAPRSESPRAPAPLWAGPKQAGFLRSWRTEPQEPRKGSVRYCPRLCIKDKGEVCFDELHPGNTCELADPRPRSGGPGGVA